MSRSLTSFALLLVVAACLLAGAGSAQASSGQITLAEANSTWTQGNFAGSISWTDCSPCVSWLPVATVQPALPSYACEGDEALDSDPNTQVVWNGGSRSGNGSVSMSASNVPILAGVVGQRICLSVIQTISIRDPICVAQAPILGLDPNSCPFVNRYPDQTVATKLMTVASGSGASGKKKPKKCAKKRSAVSAKKCTKRAA